MENAKSYGMCFACGKDNPIGLKLEFREEEGVYKTEFVPREEHQSYPGIMHGGLISTLLDEVMGRYLTEKGIPAVTAKLDIRFRKPARIGRRLFLQSQIVGERGPVIEMVAQASFDDGTVVAQASAKFMRT